MSSAYSFHDWKFLLPTLSSSSHAPHLRLRQLLICSRFLWVFFFFMTPHISEIIPSLPLSVWLISFETLSILLFHNKNWWAVILNTRFPFAKTAPLPETVGWFITLVLEKDAKLAALEIIIQRNWLPFVPGVQLLWLQTARETISLQYKKNLSVRKVKRCV